jgi:hypothetical protein
VCREATRDCHSPSGENCVCDEWCVPDDGWHDENVLVDRYGNITQRQVIEEKPPNDA